MNTGSMHDKGIFLKALFYKDNISAKENSLCLPKHTNKNSFFIKILCVCMGGRGVVDGL